LDYKYFSYLLLLAWEDSAFGVWDATLLSFTTLRNFLCLGMASCHMALLGARLYDCIVSHDSQKAANNNHFTPFTEILSPCSFAHGDREITIDSARSSVVGAFGIAPASFWPTPLFLVGVAQLQDEGAE
jgi:hypothetical protein